MGRGQNTDIDLAIHHGGSDVNGIVEGDGFDLQAVFRRKSLGDHGGESGNGLGVADRNSAEIGRSVLRRALRIRLRCAKRDAETCHK